MVCAQTNTATNLIEPKVWLLLWMEWQEILQEVGHPHLARAVRGWPGSASGTERSHAIHGSTDGTPWPGQTRMALTIRGWHGSASGTEHFTWIFPTLKKLVNRAGGSYSCPGNPKTQRSQKRLGLCTHSLLSDFGSSRSPG